MTDRTARVTGDTLQSAGQGGCLSEDEVLAFAEGSVLDPAQRTRIDQHMDTCPACLELISSVARESQSSFGQGPASYAASPPHATTFVPGALVSGRFRIERFVARGGMGEVYEAQDRKLNERVALKTVVCTAEDSPRAVRKLLDEVQLARRIQHPNVCRIHELHEHAPRGGGAPLQFLSMEFIDGERLGDYVRKRGRLPLDEAVALAQQLLAGLQAAHAAHVLHLDFKTDNVMLRRGRRPVEPVIMDFGLSRAFDSDARSRTSEQRQLAGSLAYMSPEQVQCRERLGPEADIYAFGVVFFEMLTGRLPFEGDSPVALMMKRLRERPPPPSRIVPEVTSSLDTFVLKCMSRDRRTRYRDIASVSSALEAATSGARGERWSGVVVAGVALALAFSGFASAIAWRVGSRQASPSHTVSERSLLQPDAVPVAGARAASPSDVHIDGPSAGSVASRSDGPGEPGEPSATGETSLSALPTPAVAPDPSNATAGPAARSPQPAPRRRTRATQAAPKPSAPAAAMRSSVSTAERPADAPPPASARRRSPALPGAPPGLSW
jgi:serine/threonine protein kinase